MINILIGMLISALVILGFFGAFANDLEPEAEEKRRNEP